MISVPEEKFHKLCDNELEDMLCDSIVRGIERGENLELLKQKSTQLALKARKFRRKTNRHQFQDDVNDVNKDIYTSKKCWCVLS